jgi:S1-C subfamily serine protease
MRSFAVILIMLSFISITNAQDDMYGDSYDIKTKKTKTKTQTTPNTNTNNNQSNTTTTSPNTSFNTSTEFRSADCAVIYIMRPKQKFSGNSGVFYIKFNNIPVAEMRSGNRIMYKIYSEGSLRVLMEYKDLNATQFYKSVDLNVRHGEVHYINLSNQFDDTKEMEINMGREMFYNAGNFKEEPPALLAENIATKPLIPVDKSLIKYSCFLISSQGYLLTTQSAIDKAKTITVKGVNGDFTKSVPAKLVFEDKNNNIAILKITDPNIDLPDSIPYYFNMALADSGSITSSMGYVNDKISNSYGRIISQKGYQQNIAYYTLPYSSGISQMGAPVIDTSGAVIGMLAPISGASKNLSFAVKAVYIDALIAMLPPTSGVKFHKMKITSDEWKKYIYIVEISR